MSEPAENKIPELKSLGENFGEYLIKRAKEIEQLQKENASLRGAILDVVEALRTLETWLAPQPRPAPKADEALAKFRDALREAVSKAAPENNG